MDQSKQSEIKNSSTIFINPKFKAHINPNFLNNVKPPATSTATTNNIFVNPKFISNLSSSPSDNIASPQAKIIRQTSRNLIRQPILNAVKVPSIAANKPTNLIKIGQRKLIRTNTQSKPDIKVCIRDSASEVTNNIRSKYKIVNKSLNIYKIDRTRVKPLAKDRTAKRIKYFNELITPTKVIVTDYKLCRIGNPSVSAKSGEYNLLNINGVLYKSSNTKLQKQPSSTVDNKSSRQLNRQASNSSSCSLYVRGEKFLLDPSAKKLVRVSSNQKAVTKKRIYLGGLTYIAKSNDTYEPTNSHNTRLHLSVAKQKSISLLSKNLVKSNVTCQIYRKLGKCLGLQRGRCAKVHDRNQVAICQKFLKGSCTSENCLLSHDISLSKMPTCKFFLLGQCAKSDCQYLHKKVNDKTAICYDFLRGYCARAEKCNLRHEFLCPNFESKDGCTVARCPYVHRKKTVKPERATSTISVSEPSTSLSIAAAPTLSTSTESNIRYFIRGNRKPNDKQKSNNTPHDKSISELEDSVCTVEQSIQPVDTVNECQSIDDPKPFSQRKKLGTLPSFIPID